MVFPHRNIHTDIWTSPDGKTNKIHHTLTDRRWNSSILDVRSFRVSDCYVDHYLVVAKVRKGSKQAAHKFNVKRFNLRKLNELEVRKEYHIKTLNRLAALENLNDSEETNRA